MERKEKHERDKAKHNAPKPLFAKLHMLSSCMVLMGLVIFISVQLMRGHMNGLLPTIRTVNVIMLDEVEPILDDKESLFDKNESLYAQYESSPVKKGNSSEDNNSVADANGNSPDFNGNLSDDNGDSAGDINSLMAASSTSSKEINIFPVKEEEKETHVTRYWQKLWAEAIQGNREKRDIEEENQETITTMVTTEDMMLKEGQLDLLPADLAGKLMPLDTDTLGSRIPTTDEVKDGDQEAANKLSDDSSMNKETLICGNPPDVKDALVVLISMSSGHAWCDIGFSSPVGDLRLNLECIDGVWQTSDSSGPVVAACLPLSNIENICPETMEVENGVLVVYNTSDAEVICDQGFSIPPLGIRSSSLHCIRGRWHLNSSLVWHCLPTAYEYECTDLDIPHTVIISENSTHAQVECETGFASTSGRIVTSATCHFGNWKFDLLESGVRMECLNNEPCEGSPLPELANGYVINLSGAEGWCPQGFSFFSGDSYMLYACVEGTWKLPASQQEGCLPICHDSCKNNGQCIQPDTCACPPGYTGNTCAERDSAMNVTREMFLNEREGFETTEMTRLIETGDPYEFKEITADTMEDFRDILNRQEEDSEFVINGNDTDIQYYINDTNVNKLTMLTNPQAETNFTQRLVFTQMPDAAVFSDLRDIYNSTMHFDGEMALDEREKFEATEMSSLIEGDGPEELAALLQVDKLDVGDDTTYELKEIASDTMEEISDILNRQEPDIILYDNDSEFVMNGNDTDINYYVNDTNVNKFNLLANPQTDTNLTEGVVFTEMPDNGVFTDLTANSLLNKGMLKLLDSNGGNDNSQMMFRTAQLRPDKATRLAKGLTELVQSDGLFANEKIDGERLSDPSIVVGSVIPSGSLDGRDLNSFFEVDIADSPFGQGSDSQNPNNTDIEGIPATTNITVQVTNANPSDESLVKSEAENISCGDQHPVILDAVVSFQDGIPVAVCNPKKTFKSGAKDIKLICVRGNWTFPANHKDDAEGCLDEGQCEEECENGGRCRPDNTCNCLPNFSGVFCRVPVCGPLPIVVYNAALTLGTDFPVATCHAGYTFSGGETMLEFKCVDGKWIIPERYSNMTEVTCMAVCDPPCTHGGKCVEPDLCRCPENYTGNTCDVLKCFSAPPYVRNAIIEYDPVISRAQCLDGYKLANGNATLNIECKNGEWVPDFCEDEKNTKLECQPTCEEECLNEGTCVGPNRCACPLPFDGPQCTDIRDNRCDMPPPLIRKARMNYTNTLGEANCLMGYALSTGEISINFVCSYGQWKTSEDAIRVPECLPVCTGGCQNGGTCIDANTCDCPKPYKGLLCEDVMTDICPKPPAPIPNSIVQMSPRGLLVVCRAGYAMPNGRVQTELWCMKNDWVQSTTNNALGLPVMVSDPSSNLACFPTCDPPCQNMGRCVDINKCQCHKPYAGPRCQYLESEFCWNEPPAFNNAFIKYNSSRATVTCQKGYLLDNQETAIDLMCQNGGWVLPEAIKNATCLARCIPPCSNDGVCSAPNTCTCGQRFYGNLCQEKRCPTFPTAILNSYVNTDNGQVVLACFHGYIMNTGTHKILMECTHEQWLTIETTPRTVDQLTCSPFCSQLCLNNGTCVAPNLCNCTENYAGQYCQYQRCKDLPIHDDKAEITLSNDMVQADVTCEPSYRLSTGHKQMTFTCKNGQWQGPENHYIFGSITCVPMCRKGCANGAKCVAPETCQCPLGFTGSVCNQRYGKTTAGNLCVFPFLYNDTWYEGCTTVDSTRPWCATEITVHGFISSWGVCVADLGEKKVVMTHGGEVCSLPFRDSEDKHYGCITTKERLRPSCATSVDSSGNALKWDLCDLYWGVTTVILTSDGERCQFPFTHGGKVYNKCVDNEVHRGVYPWCATKTTPQGVPSATATCKLDWGVDEVIPTKKNQVCQFPFMWKNQTVYSCLPGAPAMQGPWCATKVDKFKMMLEWDECILDKDGALVQPIGSGHRETPYAPAATQNNITTMNGLPCVSPFKFEGRKYTGCLKVDFEPPWCATTVDADYNVISKGICPNNWDLPTAKNGVSLVGGVREGMDEDTVIVTNSGRICIIPFRYEGVQFHGCIRIGSSQPFCATEVNHREESTATDTCPWDWDKNRLNHSIPGRVRLVTTVFGNKCVFPYLYNGIEYNGCISIEGGSPFCPTRVSGDKTAAETEPCAQDWGKTRLVKTVYGNDCVFPFVYKGVMHNGCISTETMEPFCATAVNHDHESLHTEPCNSDWNQDAMIGMTREKKERVRTIFGKRCIFPFVYNDVEYYGCISTASVEPFCATRVDSDKVPLDTEPCSDDWAPEKRDPALTVVGEECIFPFVYKDVFYHGCISLGTQWFCATKVDTNRNVVDTGRCVDAWGSKSKPRNPHNEGTRRITTMNGEQCIIPFIYKGNKYYGCITVGSQTPFCAVTVDRKKNTVKKGYCPKDWDNDDHSSQVQRPTKLVTQSGEKCMIPFRYGGVEYYGCATVGSAKPFCATMVDYNRVALKISQCTDNWDVVNTSFNGHIPTITTLGGRHCIIPFLYDNKEYYGCVTSGQGRPFCATEVDSDKVIAQRDYCPEDWDRAVQGGGREHLPMIVTTTGDKCINPFVREGIKHHGCISVGSEGPFCATKLGDNAEVKETGPCNDNWDENIIDREGRALIITTESGKRCVAPYVLNGVKNTGCITRVGSNRPICATQVDEYGTATETDFCPHDWELSILLYPKGGATITGEPCAFPFSYNGKTHHSCTYDKSFRPWCATKTDQDMHHSDWGYCQDGDGGGMADQMLDPCLDDVDDPYHEGYEPEYTVHMDDGEGRKIYRPNYGVVQSGKPDRYYDQWRPRPHYQLKRSHTTNVNCRTVRSISKKKCILPFKYEGVLHEDCIILTEGGAPVCAVAVDHNKIVTEWDTCSPGWYKADVFNATSLYSGKKWGKKVLNTL